MRSTSGVGKTTVPDRDQRAQGHVLGVVWGSKTSHVLQDCLGFPIHLLNEHLVVPSRFKKGNESIFVLE